LSFDLGAIEAFEAKIDLEASNYVEEDDVYEDSLGYLLRGNETVLEFTVPQCCS
jgi:hypothetical protein